MSRQPQEYRDAQVWNVAVNGTDIAQGITREEAEQHLQTHRLTVPRPGVIHVYKAIWPLAARPTWRRASLPRAFKGGVRTSGPPAAPEDLPVREPPLTIDAVLRECLAFIEDNYEQCGYATLPPIAIRARAALGVKQ